MNRLLIAPLCLIAAGCVNISDERLRIFVAARIAAENGAALRCPQTGTGRILFLAARATFNATFGHRLSPAQAEEVSNARRLADLACGFTPAEAAAAVLGVGS